MDLATLLTRLNAEIDSFNREVDEAVDQGEMDADTAAVLKVAPGSATVEMVYAESRPISFTRAVDQHTTQEHPREIMRLAKSVKQPTQVTRDLCHGSAKAKGLYPVLVKTVDLAHLLSRASA